MQTDFSGQHARNLALILAVEDAFNQPVALGFHHRGQYFPTIISNCFRKGILGTLLFALIALFKPSLRSFARYI